MEQKDLRIVYRRGLLERAEELAALIGEDSGVDASIWNEKDYTDGRRMMPKEAYVLFLGDSLALDAEIADMAKRYEQFGIRFGWAPHRAYILAAESEIEGKKKSRAFLDWLKQACPEFGPDDYADLEMENLNAVQSSVKATLNPFASVLDSMFRKPVSSAANVSELGKLQWRAAVREFYRKCLPEFLNE